jgi:uncharacterized protein (TIGR03067 family)
MGGHGRTWVPVPFPGKRTMKRKSLIILAVCLVLTAGTRAKAAKPEDKDRLQGTWMLVSAERRGEKAAEDFIKIVQLKFDGDKFAMTIDKQMKTGTFKLDTAKNPRQIDLVSDKATSPAIYKLDTDTLTLVIDADDKTRPEKFSSTGKDNLLLVFKKKQ